MPRLEYSHKGMQGFLEGPEIEAILYEVGYLTAALYESIAPHRSGRLASSVAVDVEMDTPYKSAAPRLVANVRVTAPYAAAHEHGHLTARTRRPVPGHHELNLALQGLAAS
jgi:hypothetical protein